MKPKILITTLCLIGTFSFSQNSNNEAPEEIQPVNLDKLQILSQDELKKDIVLDARLPEQSSNDTINKVDTEQGYPKSLASYNDFKNLVDEVESYRKRRLINLDKFLTMSQEENVIVLDTRSTFRYNRKHLKGAVHLGFSDFTQQTLRELIPNPNTKILIYCNNNFDGDQIDFTSKISIPDENKIIESQILSNRKPIMLALNIPTYINLYGYGYRNIYELDELVKVNDSKITFEGTEVKTVNKK